MSCNKRRVNGNLGFTLVESVLSIFLLTVFLIGVFSAFYIAKSSTLHAKHRMVAINLLKAYMEQEVQAGYDGGSGTTGDFYATMTSADPVSVAIDTNLSGTIIPDPYYPDNIKNPDGTPLKYQGIPYKIAGFIVTWTETNGKVCTEKAYVYISYHSSA